jgi:hypothetical protein
MATAKERNLHVLTSAETFSKYHCSQYSQTGNNPNALQEDNEYEMSVHLQMDHYSSVNIHKIQLHATN